MYPSPPDNTNIAAGNWLGLVLLLKYADCAPPPSVGLVAVLGDDAEAALKPPEPGTDTKNFTGSRWPWKLSWAWAIVQYGMLFVDPPGWVTIRIEPQPPLLLNAIAPIFVPLHSFNGTDIITPLPVPIHKRFDDINSAVIRTNEKPNFPVPEITLNI